MDPHIRDIVIEDVPDSTEEAVGKDWVCFAGKNYSSYTFEFSTVDEVDARNRFYDWKM